MRHRILRVKALFLVEPFNIILFGLMFKTIKYWEEVTVSSLMTFNLIKTATACMTSYRMLGLCLVLRES